MATRTGYIWPDAEQLMVAAVKQALISSGEGHIRVSMQREQQLSPETLSAVAEQVILRSQGSPQVVADIRKNEVFDVILVVKGTATSAARERANLVASKLEALASELNLFADFLTSDLISGYTRIESPTGEEVRLLTVSVATRATTITITTED